MRHTWERKWCISQVINRDTLTLYLYSSIHLNCLFIRRLNLIITTRAYMWKCTSSEWKNINREWDSLFITHIIHSLKCGTLLEKEILGLDRRQKTTAVLGDLLLFWCWFYLRGSCGVFSFMVSPRKTLCVSCLLWCAHVLLLYLLFSQWKYPNIIVLA